MVLAAALLVTIRMTASEMKENARPVMMHEAWRKNGGLMRVPDIAQGATALNDNDLLTLPDEIPNRGIGRAPTRAVPNHGLNRLNSDSTPPLFCLGVGIL